MATFDVEPAASAGERAVALGVGISHPIALGITIELVLDLALAKKLGRGIGRQSGNYFT